ncbi:MAG TPA: ion channel [Oculatellaceae cyanobacterium]
MDDVLIAAGTLIVILVLYDVFAAIVVPRQTTSALRLGPFLLNKILWPGFLKVVSLKPLTRSRSELLALFAPAAFAVIMLVWLFIMLGGFAVILYGLRADIKPAINTIGDAVYFSGTSLLTLGFGDVVALSWRARLIVLVAAISGLSFMALQVSYLFTVQNLVQQREQVVNAIVSRSGAPASGIIILLRYKELNIVNALSSSFLQWEAWISNILESHRAYVILMFFRSTNQTESWVSVLGAMLDAASLLLTSIEDVQVGEADLFYWLACSTVQALCGMHNLKYDENVHLTYEEFLQGLHLLEGAGYKTAEPERAWTLFSARRRGYIGYLCAIAQNFAIRKNYWVYDLFTIRAEEQEALRESVFRPRV